MAEILFNENIKEYTLQPKVDGVTSIKKVPLKFKLEDSTARFRKESLRKELQG